ncbi:MAG TPA: hypothetical protein VEJ63_10850 [Planctomycetota bacterium]|nr:hypothetical protein [Planctomycetota bacterium]
MNRAFTFSNPKIIRRLKEEFIPYAGATIELQPNVILGLKPFPTTDWFMAMANQAKWRSTQGGNTTQGTYIAGADGKMYAWKNTPGVSSTLKFMDEGLAAFKKTPPKTVEISKETLEAPFCRAAKPTTTVCAVYSRVRPVPAGADTRNYNLGREYVWLYTEEAAALLKSLDAKTALQLPDSMISRLVRFTLIDVIRGEADFWMPRHVRKAEFTLKHIGSVEVDAPQNEDAKTAQAKVRVERFEFSGDFSSATGTFTGHGLEGHIDGEFDIDPAKEQFTGFRAYAKCEAWGATPLGNKGAIRGKFPLVFAIVETKDPAAREIPPSGVSRDRDYKIPDELPALKAARAKAAATAPAQEKVLAPTPKPTEP